MKYQINEFNKLEERMIILHACVYLSLAYAKIFFLYKAFLQSGFRSRSREPAIKIDGSKTLRHLLLELMKAYIFYHSRNITKKCGPLFTKLLYFELWEPGASYKNRRLRNPAYNNDRWLIAKYLKLSFVVVEVQFVCSKLAKLNFCSGHTLDQI